MDSSSVPRSNRLMTDEELSALLQAWGPVHAPASLEARVFSMPKHTLGGWSRMASRSVRVPVPVVAMTVAVFLGLTVWSVVVGHNLPGTTGVPLPLSQSSAARPSATLVGGNPSPKRIQVPASVQAINTIDRVPARVPARRQGKGRRRNRHSRCHHRRRRHGQGFNRPLRRWCACVCSHHRCPAVGF